MTQSFTITDADIQAALQILDSHASTMRSTISHVESVGSNIGSAYRSQTSTLFQQQLQSWGEIYGQLLQKVSTVRDNLTQANAGISSTADEASSKVNTVGGQISDILAGH